MLANPGGHYAVIFHCLCHHSHLYHFVCQRYQLVYIQPFRHRKLAQPSDCIFSFRAHYRSLLSLHIRASSVPYSSSQKGVLSAACCICPSSFCCHNPISSFSGTVSILPACGVCLCFFSAFAVMPVSDALETVFIVPKCPYFLASIPLLSGFNHCFQRYPAFDCRNHQHGAGTVFYFVHHHHAAKTLPPIHLQFF